MHFGVAAALEIEQALLAPAVLVVADQGPRAVRRQRGLAGAGEAEEDRGVALGADIRRAMHRQHVLGRQHVVQIAEHRLLDLAGVFGAADQHQLLGEIDEDEGVGPYAVDLVRREEMRRVQNGEIGHVAFQFLRLGADEHVAREQRMPRARRRHPHLQPVGRVGAAMQILHEHLAPLVIGQDAAVQAVERRFRQLLVGRVPVDVGFARGFLDDVFVLGGAAGEGAGDRDEGAARAQPPFAPADGVLVEDRHRQVPMLGGQAAEALFVQAEARRESVDGLGGVFQKRVSSRGSR